MNKHNRRARIVLWATSAVLVLCASCGTRQNRQTRTPNIESVIPVPVQTENFEVPASKEIRPLVLNRHTAIVCTDSTFAPVAEYLARKVRTATGYELKIADRLPDEGRNYILLTRTDSVAQAEGYRLVSSPDETVCIAAQAPAGAFYGVQTLLQLLPPEIESPVKVKDVAWELPVGVIDDYPRFKYRGVHFDPSRHFAGVEFIKKQLDVLAMFKINRFHWHLTDDQLWTIEIKKYPELTAKGAVRTEGDGSTHRGFYTQDEIREVVAYAAARYIDVIPEIEMPGHAKAALVSHPELSCTGGPFDQPRVIWGVEDDVFCPGKDTTFAFLENVLTEVFDLFPSEYIHIGGDEFIDFNHFELFPEMEACAKERLGPGCGGVDLYVEFLNEVIAHVRAKGFQVRVWNDGLFRPDQAEHVELDRNVQIGFWSNWDKGMAPLQAFLDRGYQVVNYHSDYLYFILLIRQDYKDPDPDRIMKEWAPRVFPTHPLTGPQTLDPASRQMLGCCYSIWSDWPDLEDEEEVDRRSRDSIRAFALRCWQ